MTPLERKLRADGYRTLNLAYPSRAHDVDTLARRIAPDVASFAGGLQGALHFVTHSMGGVVARALIARDRPPRLGRLVMLGPPNGGSEIVDRWKERRAFRAFFGPAVDDLSTIRAARRARDLGPPDYEVGIIAGVGSINPIASRFILPRPNDGAVSLASTRLDGMTDHMTIRAAHTFLPIDSRVIAQTRAFLRNGAFARPA